MRRFILFILVLCMVLTSCNMKKTPYLKVNISDVASIVTPQDSVMLPGGFQIGMTEAEIKKVVIDNPERFYFDKNDPLMQLHMGINDQDYFILLHLYRGCLQSVDYFGQSKWVSVNDTLLKTHYKAVYELVNSLNRYYKIENKYLRNYKEDWPYSIGYNDLIFMDAFMFNDDLLHEGIVLSLYSFKNDISVNINYSNELKEGTESTLRQTVLFYK